MTAKDDPTITPDMRLRAAGMLAQYQHPKPFPLKETFVGPIDYAAPKTVEGARAAILNLGQRMARREISVEARQALTGLAIRADVGRREQPQTTRVRHLGRTQRSACSIKHCWLDPWIHEYRAVKAEVERTGDDSLFADFERRFIADMRKRDGPAR